MFLFCGLSKFFEEDRYSSNNLNSDSLYDYICGGCSDYIFCKFVKILINQSRGKLYGYHEERTKDQILNLCKQLYDFFISNVPDKDECIEIKNCCSKKEKFDSEIDYAYINILNYDGRFLFKAIEGVVLSHGINFWISIDFVLRVKRSHFGEVLDISEDFSANAPEDYRDESVIYLEAKKTIKKDESLQIKKELKRASKFVASCASEYDLINKKITKSIDELKKDLKSVSDKEECELDSKEDFYLEGLRSWLLGEYFIPVGYATYHFKDNEKYEILDLTKTLNDFIKDDIKNYIFADGNSFLSGYCKSIVFGILPVHSIASINFLYNIDIFVGDKKEQLHRVFGLMLREARSKDIDSMPVIKEKIKSIIFDLGYKPMSFGYMKIKNILQNLPIEFFLTMNDKEIIECIEKVNALSASDSSFTLKKLPNSSFILSLAVVGREFYEQDNMICVEKFLSEKLDCKKAFFYSRVNDYGFVFNTILLKLDSDKNDLSAFELLEVQRDCAKLLSSWEEKLLLHISSIKSKRESSIKISKFLFSSGYKNDFDCKEAYSDMLLIEAMNLRGESIDVKLKKKSDFFALYTYSFEKKIDLSDIVPVIENMSYKIIDHKANDVFFNNCRIWVQQYDINLQGSYESFSLEDNILVLCQETIRDVICGRLDNSVFNKLVSSSGISSRQVFLIISITAYLKQIGIQYSNEYISECLVKHNKITSLLVALFDSKFSPLLVDENLEKKIIEKIEDSMSLVENIAEDLILSGFFELIRYGIVRANFYQSEKDYVAFKVIPSNIESIPLPKPYAEIFVYSKIFEGIHLRGGQVARGGIRWSDRKEDYRMEVLGLMKAQMTKNSIIVPVGAKGGFVIKDESVMESRELVVKSYQNFIRGLLDLTDNIVDGNIKRAEDIVCLDGEDHYLVVAADKGTATFSDFANSVSKEYKFWLGDAFASGGSSGYDHKVMGITARGAWVCAVNHLKKIGIQAHKDAFSVVGIGDMSGDVFGNGMLLSKCIKLVAAFNHSHIFVDPDPDLESSWKERKRLFELRGSKWTDYRILSEGGAVYSRSLKKINVTDKIMELLKLEKNVLTPTELIRKILCMNVDLIWNGGIGTYVKSETEANDTINDKTNDDLRVNGNMLNAKIVVEGGNLGFTQLGRIEYASSGGLIHTDFIDNCGGVNCSDREVNIKISLISAMHSGKVSLEERNKIMLQMTEEVAEKVLTDSAMQTEALSIAINHCKKRMSEYCRFATKIEELSIIDSKLEFVPTEKERRQMLNEGKSFTSPILSVLLAYSKIWVFKELINTNVSSENYFEKFLINYFPKLMRDEFIDEIKCHVLKNDILANVISNIIVNKVGITFVSNMVDALSAKVCDIVRAYFIVKEIFDTVAYCENFSDIGNYTFEEDICLFEESRSLFDRCCRWLIKNHGTAKDIESMIGELKPKVLLIFSNFEKILSKSKQDDRENNISKLVNNGCPNELAVRISSIKYMANSLSVIKASTIYKIDLISVANIFSCIEDELCIDYLRQSIKSLESSSYRRIFAINSIVEEVNDCCAKIVENLLKEDFNDTLSIDKVVDKWRERQADCIIIYKNFLSDLTLNGELELEGFIILLQKLKAFR